MTFEEGRQLAAQLGCPFFETSAALRHYIDDAFHALIREIRRKNHRQVDNLCFERKIVLLESFNSIFFPEW